MSAGAHPTKPSASSNLSQVPASTGVDSQCNRLSHVALCLAGAPDPRRRRPEAHRLGRASLPLLRMPGLGAGVRAASQWGVNSEATPAGADPTQGSGGAGRAGPHPSIRRRREGGADPQQAGRRRGQPPRGRALVPPGGNPARSAGAAGSSVRLVRPVVRPEIGPPDRRGNGAADRLAWPGAQAEDGGSGGSSPSDPFRAELDVMHGRSRR